MAFHEQAAREIHFANDWPITNHPTKGRQIVRIIASAMKAAILRGESISIPGLGVFRIVTKRATRTGSNIVRYNSPYRLPIPLSHPPKRVLMFYPAEQLRAMLNGPSNWHERRAVESWSE